MIIHLLVNKTDDIKKIFDEKSEISEKIKVSKRPIIILGESALELKVANIFLKN